MKITFTVSDVDYDALADALIPMMEEQAGGSVWFSSPLTSGGRATQTAKALLSRMPQKRKDALLANYINRSGDQIARMLMDAARTKGVALRVSEVKAENE